ncbi:MAG: hypothetical protein ACYC35_08245 [Pirellulales bacterium]
MLFIVRSGRGTCKRKRKRKRGEPAARTLLQKTLGEPQANKKVLPKTAGSPVMTESGTRTFLIDDLSGISG